MTAGPWRTEPVMLTMRSGAEDESRAAKQSAASERASVEEQHGNVE